MDAEKDEIMETYRKENERNTKKKIGGLFEGGFAEDENQNGLIYGRAE